jgi:hypothetical protein
MTAMATTIIILTFCMSFAIYLGTGNGTMFTQMLGLSGTGGSLYSSFYLLLTVTAVVSVAVGLISFPNPYALFSVITVLILSFVTLPVDLLTSAILPTNIKLLVGGVFGIMYLMAVLGWYKGGAEP